MRSCLEKLSKSTRINSLKPASLEPISEIISDLCSVVSFIVLSLIRYCTTNIRTLELTHVLGTVSTKEAEIPQEGFSLIFRRVKLLPDSNRLKLLIEKRKFLGIENLGVIKGANRISC